MPVTEQRNTSRRWPIGPSTRWVLLVSLCFLVAGSMVGCARFRGGPPSTTDRELIQEGIEAFNNGRYSKAIGIFQTIRDRFPFSPHVILAEQKIADCHYLRGQYPEAIYAYQDFEKLHPRHPLIPYIIYQTGMCYYKQMTGFDQDQEYTRQAAAEFDRLIKTYPRSPYGIPAENRLNECLKRLSQFELYVGKIYFKLKKYKAAKARFEGIVRNLPDQGEYREAFEYIAEADRLIAAREKKGEVEEDESGHYVEVPLEFQPKPTE